MTQTAVQPIPDVRLDSHISIPQIGFGTYQIPAADTQRAVEQALEIGYRHIDTAAAYYNEHEVGLALKATGMADRVFITSKLRNCDQGFDAARFAFDKSLSKLGIDRLDLYLIHWPFPAVDQYVDTWKALLSLKSDGLIRTAGVSNFLPSHLQRLIDQTGEAPAINQLEIHPSFSQPETLRFCEEHGITVEAYSPLGHGTDMKSPAILQAANSHHVSPAQIVLRWHIQEGRVIIPKSSHREHMVQNLDLFDFELEPDEMRTISALHVSDMRVSGDPNTFNQSQSWANQRARGNVTD